VTATLSRTAPRLSWRTARWGLLGLCWLGTVGVGLAQVWRFENTAGAQEPPPPLWPADSRIPRPGGLPTLVMLAHPRCACTRASLGELARLMSRLEGRVQATVVFLRPPGTITVARGHAGDNAGADRIARLVSGERGATAGVPVFGCALQETEETLTKARGGLP
jgi:hypothetical protein